MGDAAWVGLIAAVSFVILCWIFRDREVEGGVGPAWFKAGKSARRLRKRRRRKPNSGQS